MPAPIVLTPHQVDAVTFLADALVDGAKVVALRGLAGCGKTSLLPTLLATLEGAGLSVTLAAPTHRAAMILKRKGLEGADTVHSHALTPYFTGDYAKALQWLGTSCPCKVEALANAHLPVNGVPWLIAERLMVTGDLPQTVKSRASQYDPKRALESIGIYGRQHFAGFGPKMGTGVLIIDEASMVGSDMLALCQAAFPQICLVGDQGQLPPVQDAAALASVEGFTLTEIHRQAQESPIVQLAYAAREGQAFWERIPRHEGQLEEFRSVEAAQFLTSPLLVWRNKVRLSCTHAIRQALGYPADAPTIGEPLVCRSSDPRARADGFYNNALFRVVAVSSHNARLVTVVPDGAEDGEPHDVLVHMEETHGANINPEAILFRYGYCLTAHTAQGGEWPTVYISKPDLLAQTKRAPAEGDDAHALRQWAYTAITRAKTMLGFLTTHDFTTTTALAPQTWGQLAVPEGAMMPRMQHTPATIAPPSAPLLGTQPEPDDLDDPEVPGAVLAVMGDDPMAPAVPGIATQAPPTSAVVPTNGQTRYAMPAGLEPSHDALLRGFTQYMHTAVGELIRDESIRITKSADHAMQSMHDYVKGVLQSLAYGAKEPAGVPYEMALRVRTPGGIPLTLTIRKQTPADLLDELTRLEGWLAANGYTGVAA